MQACARMVIGIWIDFDVCVRDFKRATQPKSQLLSTAIIAFFGHLHSIKIYLRVIQGVHKKQPGKPEWIVIWSPFFWRESRNWTVHTALALQPSRAVEKGSRPGHVCLFGPSKSPGVSSWSPFESQFSLTSHVRRQVRAWFSRTDRVKFERQAACSEAQPLRKYTRNDLSYEGRT